MSLHPSSDPISSGARIFVAGHRGLVGSAIVRRLGAQGVEPIAGDGVDEWRWAPLEEAADELTWKRDQEVLDSFRELV